MKHLYETLTLNETKEKTFAELKEGDKFYFWNPAKRNFAEEYSFVEFKKLGPTDFQINLIYKDNNGDDNMLIPLEYLNKSYAPDTKNPKWCIATTFDELVYTIKKGCRIVVKDFKPYEGK